MNQWICLITSLPTENSTVRMRTWRALKASGAAVLRDGVYVLPDVGHCRAGLEALACDVVSAGGTAMVMGLAPPDAAEFEQRFDRSGEYQALSDQATQALAVLTADSAAETLKLARKLRKGFAQIGEVDFFPGETQSQTDGLLGELELACARALSPGEPMAVEGELALLNLADYQGRVWVTRERPWADRLASAWLIKRFIDMQANIQWMAQPDERPSGALGFDFDGAEFSHVGHRITFEVLLASFGFTDPALSRLGAVVHYLDVGGLQPPEALGLEAVLTGLKASLKNDDALLDAACVVLDGMLAGFSPTGSGT